MKLSGRSRTPARGKSLGEVAPALVATILVVVVVLGAAAYFFFWPQSPPPPPPGPANAEAPRVTPTRSGPLYPVPEEAAAPKPLPELAESDATIIEALRSLMGPDPVARFFIPEDLIRHIVATIDNLPRERFSVRLSPVNLPGGVFRITGRDETLSIAPDNAARYTPYIRALESVEPKKVVELYLRFYPLFQKAYADLGFPQGYFNDRLVEVIDHLLDAPDLREPVKLASPHVLYEFADPDLESRSAGQKLLIRMGPDNEARVKTRLRDIRRELIARAPQR
ncbi:MAG TPA: DUF3014 domain-containing protein [Usitatibacter sp.]